MNIQNANYRNTKMKNTKCKMLYKNTKDTANSNVKNSEGTELQGGSQLFHFSWYLCR